MIYTVQTSKSADLIIEAVGYPSHPPVGKFQEDYFGDSSYRAVRREGWTPDCYPRCTSATTGNGGTLESFPVVTVP